MSEDTLGALSFIGFGAFMLWLVFASTIGYDANSECRKQFNEQMEYGDTIRYDWFEGGCRIYRKEKPAPLKLLD